MPTDLPKPLPVRLLRWRAVAALLVIALALAPLSASPSAAHGRDHGHGRPVVAKDRVIAYYQTIYTTAADGTTHYVDPKPLLGRVTDVNVGAIHLNAGYELKVNDDPADAPKFDRMWRDLRRLQHHGVKISAFVGGAGIGSYDNLTKDFDGYYALLRDFLRTYRLDGVDLDIEEPYALEDTIRLVRRLRRDFGPRFLITLTPVAKDLAGESTFSGGFSYAELERRAGHMINWYNTQFYCNWGDLAETTDYDAIVAAGFAPSRIVAGTVDNPANCAGWVEPKQLRTVIKQLNRKYPDFGGAFGWEFFNAVGGSKWFGNVKRATERY